MVGCPGCGSKLVFDIKTQQMKCSYCGKFYLVSQVSERSKNAEEHKESADYAPQPAGYPDYFGQDEFGDEFSHIGESAPVNDKEMQVTVFTCSQCGAEIVADADEAVTWCSYCGSPATLRSRLSRIRKPDKVIPFKVTKEECVARYLAVARKQIYAPSDLIRMGKAESFRGIYMPFWTYDVDRDGEYRFPGMTVETVGNTQVTTRYMASGHLNSHHEGLSHDASLTFDDYVSEQIIPFMEKDAVPFDECYMNGFYANAADQKDTEYRSKILSMEGDLIMNHAKWQFRSIGLQESQAKSQLSDYGAYKVKTKAELEMDPVWFLSYRRGDRVSYATVNGQMGRLYADFPASPAKFFLFSLISAIPVFLLLNLMLTAAPSFVLFLAVIAAFAASSMFKSEIEDIFAKQCHIKPDPKTDKMKIVKKVLSGIGTALLIIVFASIELLPDILSAGSELSGVFRAEYLYIIVAAVILIVLGVRFFKMKNKYMSLSNVWMNLSNGLYFLVSAVSLVIFIARPADDWIYYIIAFAAAGIVALSVTNLIRSYNILSTQKPKQFSRSGGDDDAA